MLATIYLVLMHGYSDGQWVDLWSIPHLLFGVTVVLGAAVAGIGMLTAFAITIEFAVLWEIFEHFITNIGRSESATNSLSDVALALVGFVLGLVLVRFVKNERTRNILFGTFLILWLLLNFIGWLVYQTNAPLPS